MIFNQTNLADSKQCAGEVNIFKPSAVNQNTAVHVKVLALIEENWPNSSVCL